MLMSDSGPDFNPMHFKYLQLDFLSVFTYAARYSAFNCVEYLWSPLSNRLAGVIFSPQHPGDKKGPIELTSITADERKKKEKYVFNRAMNALMEEHWNDSTFDGCPVGVDMVKCDEDNLLYDDHENIKLLLKTFEMCTAFLL